MGLYSKYDAAESLARIGIRYWPKRSYGRKYNIAIGEKTFTCSSYEAFSIDIPAVSSGNYDDSLGSRVSNAWNKSDDFSALGFLVDVIFPESSSGGKDAFHLKSIELIALQCKYDEVIILAKQKDKNSVEKCLSASEESEEKYSKACAQFLNDLETKLKLLDFGTEYSFVYTDSFQGIPEQFEGQRREQIKNEELFSSQIISEFEKGNYLCSASLTNDEKLEEYRRVVSFCTSYFPELADREFDVKSLSCKYPEFLDKKDVDDFSENWFRLYRSFVSLDRGVRGEAKVAEVLELFDDRVRILRNYKWGYEHDFVIISPFGLFTIEVKNLYGNYVLTPTGVLKCMSSNKVAPKDVALQSKKHLESLRRNLKGCQVFNKRIPLQEIICSAESNFTIKDEYHFVPVCYYNTIDKIFYPADGETVLNDSEMKEIEKYLIENQSPVSRYDVFLPKGEVDSKESFIRSFANVASGVKSGKKAIG